MNQKEDGGAEVLGLVDEHLDSVRERLTDAQYELLLTRLRALADTPGGDARAVLRAFQAVRLCLVPLPFDHPVREALDAVRFAGAAPVGHLAVLRTQMLLARITADPDPPPETSAVIAAVEDRLLRAPALSATEVRTRYRGAAPPAELIRLADPDLGDRYPEFQFEPGGPPYEVVLEVNRVLLADADPWGAADWWLSGNPWLGGGPPADLLGVRPDRELVGAAVALVEGA
ncbi:hypothetical protein [Streptomyces flavofungini]|uniref:hypothetical protein n=1 Tax=Streptomyces flavofungini TaxID=68200 RepID=UPI0025B0784D|nr:hypothetical protein [Streptomyces flavofungini]WJV44693.1 hypothetical protein QUY26_03615 [Streptomyces flavofungini]